MRFIVQFFRACECVGTGDGQLQRRARWIEEGGPVFGRKQTECHSLREADCEECFGANFGRLRLGWKRAEQSIADDRDGGPGACSGSGVKTNPTDWELSRKLRMHSDSRSPQSFREEAEMGKRASYHDTVLMGSGTDQVEPSPAGVHGRHAKLLRHEGIDAG